MESNKIIWKDTIKGYDVIASQTYYGAIIMNASHRCLSGVHESFTWLGGIKDIFHAKELCLKYIDENIAFEIKMEKARAAYSAIMAT